MSEAGASERARLLDGGLERLLAAIILPASRNTIAQLRTYLLKQDAEIAMQNNVLGIFKTGTSKNVVFISLGPSFDKGPTKSHFYLESGSRLSFGTTLRETNGRCSLVAYRFQLNLPDGHSPSFFRFDLNDKAHDTPLLSRDVTFILAQKRSGFLARH